MMTDIPNFADQAPTLRIASEDALAAGGWVAEAKQALAEKGAVLLRGPVTRPDAAELALSMIDPELLEDAFWSTPRSKVEGKTLTATEYPSPRTIQLHSEMAYMRAWPRFVAFHSIIVAEEGGETTVCDIDRMSARLGPLLDRLREKGVAYRRTFQKGVDIAWQHAFQTEDRADVEAVGRELGMTVEWLPNDVLRTTHVAQGTIDAEDGRPIYFNQSHLFHPSSLGAQMREALEKLYGADKLPRQSMYGDLSPIADEDLDAVRTAFEAEQTRMCWQAGDILILDNMRYAHGRLPFKGSRKLHVALARKEDRTVRTPLAA